MAPIKVPVSCLVSQPMSTSAAAHTSIAGRILISPSPASLLPLPLTPIPHPPRGRHEPSSSAANRRSPGNARPDLGKNTTCTQAVLGAWREAHGGALSAGERQGQAHAEATDLGSAQLELAAIR